MPIDLTVEEAWVEVQGFDRYEVSNYGRIRNIKTSRILKPRLHSRGYYTVHLYTGKGGTDLYIHRIVAQHFMKNYRERSYIGHRDKNKANNHVMNLKSAGGSRYRNGRRPRTGRKVRIIELDKPFVNAYAAARYIRGDENSVYRVIRGDQRTHLGYTFEFIDPS